MSTTDDGLKPSPHQAAAQQFLTELRTRISTQPLPYQYGVEARALTSMWEVFGEARDAVKGNPGCEKFATKTTNVLNIVMRPLTAKWHRAFEERRLNGRDGADEFRGELQDVLEELRKFGFIANKPVPYVRQEKKYLDQESRVEVKKRMAKPRIK